MILTSGTTGTPKGASRRMPKSLDPVAALLSKIPLRAREKTMIAAPLFHSWGFAHYTLGVPLASTFVLRAQLRPGGHAARHRRATRATALVVVPVMLQRILELPHEMLDRYDTSSLRVDRRQRLGAAGPARDARDGPLRRRASTTSTARPRSRGRRSPRREDLRAAPGSAGRPPLGTIVKLFDDEDREVAPGETGRIFVAQRLPVRGLHGRRHKATIGGLMSSGDVGHFDAAGRLFIDGRDDDMIVSGGENVFPAEVEDLLAGHPAVARGRRRRRRRRGVRASA